MSLLSILGTPDLELEINAGCPYIGRARNQLTYNFLATDCDRMLMIDSDIMFNRDHLLRILSHDMDIIGGFYFMKVDKSPFGRGAGSTVICEPLDGVKWEDDEELMELKYIGTGFLSIKRNVFDRMIEVYGEELGYKCELTQRREYDFWTTGVHRPTDRWLGEDWYFCQRARDLGFKIYGDKECVVPHLGHAIYPIRHESIPQAAAAN